MSTPMTCPETSNLCAKSCKTACEERLAKLQGNETVFSGFDNNGQPLYLPDPLIASELTALRARLAECEADNANSFAIWKEEIEREKLRNAAARKALEMADFALRMVPHRSRDDAFMALLGREYITPAIKSIDAAKEDKP